MKPRGVAVIWSVATTVLIGYVLNAVPGSLRATVETKPLSWISSTAKTIATTGLSGDAEDGLYDRP